MLSRNEPPEIMEQLMANSTGTAGPSAVYASDVFFLPRCLEMPGQEVLCSAAVCPGLMLRETHVGSFLAIWHKTPHLYSRQTLLGYFANTFR